jgi:hypothetical protein
MDSSSDNPKITLEIKPEGVFGLLSHITIVDRSGQATFQQVIDNAATIDLGQLEPLKGSILQVAGTANNVPEFEEGAITYTLLYDGSPGKAPDQVYKVGADDIKRGIFGFLLRFCPRHPFC